MDATVGSRGANGERFEKRVDKRFSRWLWIAVLGFAFAFAAAMAYSNYRRKFEEKVYNDLHALVTKLANQGGALRTLHEELGRIQRPKTASPDLRKKTRTRIFETTRLAIEADSELAGLRLLIKKMSESQAVACTREAGQAEMWLEPDGGGLHLWCKMLEADLEQHGR